MELKIHCTGELARKPCRKNIRNRYLMLRSHLKWLSSGEESGWAGVQPGPIRISYGWCLDYFCLRLRSTRTAPLSNATALAAELASISGTPVGIANANDEAPISINNIPVIFNMSISVPFL